MRVLNTKTFEELKEEGSQDLHAIGFSTDAGSIAKLFLNIVNKLVGNAYNTLTVNHLRAFVTTADGDALDAIGKLLMCQRKMNEDDENYRYRITQQCAVLATSNTTAVRLTTLTVNGVADCIPKEYSMGAGSFTVIIITDGTRTTEETIQAVKVALLDVHGYGIRYNVTTPTLNYVKIRQRIQINERIGTAERQSIKYDVQIALAKYFNELAIGENIMVDKITQIIMNVSPEIIQEWNDGLWINGEKSVYVNQQCRWFERFALAREGDNIIIL